MPFVSIMEISLKILHPSPNEYSSTCDLELAAGGMKPAAHLTLNLGMRPAAHLTLNLGMRPAAHLTLNSGMRPAAPLTWNFDLELATGEG